MNDIDQGNDMRRTQKENTNDDDVFDPSLFDLKKLSTGNLKIPFSINGLDLEEEEMTKLELRIQEMLRTEIVGYVESLKPKDLKDNPPATPKTISVSLESLSLPFEIRQSLESRTRNMITEIVSKKEGPINGCAFTPIYPPAQVQRFTSSDILIGRWFDWNPRIPGADPRNPEDKFKIYIFPDITLPQDRIEVGLQLSGNVGWAKEIQAWHQRPAIGRGNSVRVERGPSDAVYLSLRKPDCFGGAHNIIFRKPKFLGIWTDMYFIDEQSLWGAFRGRHVIFQWIKDL